MRGALAKSSAILAKLRKSASLPKLLRGLREPAFDGHHAERLARVAFADLDTVADRVTDECAADRRLERDHVRSVMVLLVAENPVGDHLVGRLEHHFGAHADGAVTVFELVHEARALKPQLERRDQ